MVILPFKLQKNIPLTLFLILLGAVIFEIFYYFSINTTQNRNLDNSIERNENYRVISGNSVDGSDIIYESSKTEEYLYSGSGIMTIYSQGITDAYKLIGYFESLEIIPNSTDRYLITKDPSTGQLLPKVRLIKDFRISPEGERLQTALAMEILDSDKTQFEYHQKKIGTIGDNGWQSLEENLKQGNVVSVLLKRKTNSGEALRDEDDNLVSARLVLRRKNEPENF